MPVQTPCHIWQNCAFDMAEAVCESKQMTSTAKRAIPNVLIVPLLKVIRAHSFSISLQLKHSPHGVEQRKKENLQLGSVLPESSFPLVGQRASPSELTR